MKRFSHPGTVHTYGFSPGEAEKKSDNDFYLLIVTVSSCGEAGEGLRRFLVFCSLWTLSDFSLHSKVEILQFYNVP